jgi:hypothetical protein
MAAIAPVSKDNAAFNEALNNTVVGKTKSEVARKILVYAAPGERMAIWGWADKYHVETQLPQGTREPHPYYHIVGSDLQDYYTNRYIADLGRNQPALFLDAVAPGQFMFTDHATQGYRNFPKVKNYIDAHYIPVDTVEGVKILVSKQKAQQLANLIKPASLTMATPVVRKEALPAEQGKITKSIDFFDESKDYISLSGWAFLNNYPSEDNIIEIVLYNENQTFFSKVNQFSRPDVAVSLHVNIVKCGFSATISKAALPTGSYQVAVLIRNLANNFEDVVFINYLVTI